MLIKIYLWPDGGVGNYSSGGNAVVGMGESLEQAKENLGEKLQTHISIARTAAEKSALKAQKLEELQSSLDK